MPKSRVEMLAVQNIGPIVLSKLQRARLRRRTWKKIRIDVLNRKSAGEEPRIFHPGILISPWEF